MIDDALSPTADPAWILSVDGFDPLRESCYESRFAISNGFLGVRAARAASRGERWVVPARTYVAGLFDGPGSELVPAADWLRLRIVLPSGALVSHPNDVLARRMTLDLRKGALGSAGHMKSPLLCVAIRTMRLVSRHDPSVGLQLVEAVVQKGETEITFEASFDGLDLGLIPVSVEQALGVWRTLSSGKTVAMATDPSLQVDGREIAANPFLGQKWSWTWTARPSQTMCFQRLVAIARGEDGHAAAGDTARDSLRRAHGIGWRAIVAAHEAAWDTRWRHSDIRIGGDAAAQQVARFALYHLNSAANPADERVSIGARALTGDNYHGHVFWDTEIFLLPFYTMTWPEAARSLLMYRFHTLPAARQKAAAAGWRGAMYAWESADTGAEMTPDHVIGPDRRVVAILSGKQEQHISADIAYAVWQYWQATGDEGFLLAAGAEIILETGRFWASRAVLEPDGSRHIRGVIGPDEYHEHIDDNAYTNAMAHWNIARATEVAALLLARWPSRWDSLSRAIGLGGAELGQWRSVAAAIPTGQRAGTGLFEQFSGYFALEDIDLGQYAGRSVPMDVVLGRERTQASQVVKQADVVALMALLPDLFSPVSAAANFGYYEPRCGHGSSLSPAMHGMVAARLGDSEMALRFYRQAAEIDLGDTTASIDGGVHIAALGGIWMLAVFGFGGLSVRDDGLALEPLLPASWTSLDFAVHWRGRRVTVRIAAEAVEVTLEDGEPMTVTIGGKPSEIARGRPVCVELSREADGTGRSARLWTNHAPDAAASQGPVPG